MPHWALTEEEASSVSRSATDVLRHYDLKASQKTIDICTLIMVLGSVYGTRGLVTVMESRARREQKQAMAGAAPASGIGVGMLYGGDGTAAAVN